MYIYRIVDKENNKCYVGQSTKDVNKSENYYGSGIIISNLLQKYGKDRFHKEILCECNSEKELNEKEQYYIKYYNSIRPNGYNISEGGGGYSHWTDKELTEKHKNNISKGVGSVYSDKNGRVYKNWMQGMRDNKVREKISKKLKGREPWNKGKTDVYTDEQLEKMSEAAKNRNIDEETERQRREKISKYFSENHPNRKKVIDHRDDDKEYDSVKEFCEKTGTSWYVSRRLRKENKITVL